MMDEMVTVDQTSVPALFRLMMMTQADNDDYFALHCLNLCRLLKNSWCKDYDYAQ